ncbi:hypothetical protein [Bacillus sp. mrc49]|uniref:hypothetical protein n=1 Tax=Bacillus sp. mrc49 TaxID=2054913 RepID=UPI000C26FB20|nr:hypothetical protein [Bacillus sp. mrc49]PJN89910.1 hypothetical protein CVN76_11320 [Bacillus sp. mrc49]
MKAKDAIHDTVGSQERRSGMTMFIIWLAIAIFLFFIALELGVSYWLNSEMDEKLSKPQEMLHNIREKLVRKRVS